MSEHAGSSGSGKAVGFDPYHKWLGIHPSEQPPHFYRLLGTVSFESDADVIANAADARMAHVKNFQAGAHSDSSQRILNELARAKLCLLAPTKKVEYDQWLRERLAAATPPPDEDDCYELRRESVVERCPAPMHFLKASEFKPTMATAESRRKKSSDRFMMMCFLGATAVAVAVILPLYLNATRNDAPTSGPTKSRAAASPRSTVPDRAAQSRKNNSSALPKKPEKRSSNHLLNGSRPQYVKPNPAFGLVPNSNGTTTIPGRNSGVSPRKSSQGKPGDVAPLSKPDLIEKINPSIVVIYTDRALGSGFVIDDDGLIVTNYHVIEDASKATAKFSNDTTIEIAGYVAVDKGRDLAILRAAPSGNMKLLSLPLRENLPRVGESVLAFGSPKGFDFTTSDGIISAVRNGKEIRSILKNTLNVDGYELMGYDINSTWIQTTAAISQGNSGGPLVTMDGEVVGINTWHRAGAQNLNFAISATYIAMLIKNISTNTQPFSSLPRPKPSKAPDNKGKAIPPLRIDLTLPSGAVLCESMLEVPVKWRGKYFPSTATVYVATWPNGNVRGAFSLEDDAKLDGYAITLHEGGNFQTLALYKKAKLDDRMIHWKENGERLFFAEHKAGNKHGLFCFFRDDLPWLIQEWDKGTMQSEYLVQYPEGVPRLTLKADLNEQESKEYAKAASELALLESTLKKNEAQLKQELAKWYRKEDKRLKRERVSKLSPEKRDRMLDDIFERNQAKQKAFLRKRLNIQNGNY